MNMGSVWNECRGQLPEGLAGWAMGVALDLETERRQGRLGALQVLWSTSERLALRWGAPWGPVIVVQ